MQSQNQMINKEKVIHSQSKDNFRILLSKTEVNWCHLYSPFDYHNIRAFHKIWKYVAERARKAHADKEINLCFGTGSCVKTVVLSFDFGSSLVIPEIMKAKTGKNNQRDKNVEYPVVERSNSLGF